MKHFKPIILAVFVQSFLLILPAQANHKEVNGCGDAKGLGRFVPNQPTGVDFRPICDNHDACYGILGQPRQDCDNNFRSQLRAKCEKTLLRSAKGIIGTFVTGGQALASCYGVAELYYQGVKERGGTAYRISQEHAQQEQKSSAAFSEWQEYPGDGRGTDIAVTQDGNPVIIGTDQRIYKGSGSGLVELSGDGRGTDIAIDGGGKVWIVGTDKRIFFHNGSAWQEYPGGGRGQSIAVAKDGNPVIIGTDQHIYKGSGSGWVQLSNDKGKNIAIDGGGKVWIVGINNTIYSYPKG